jgi:hypothetical protein
MRGIAFWFATLAIASLIVGMAYGIFMSASGDFTTAPAHGHLNLLGFVLGMLFAFYYTLAPQAQGRLAWAHFWSHQVAVATMFPGVILATTGGSEALAKGSSALALISVLIFAAVHLTAGRRAVPA